MLGKFGPGAPLPRLKAHSSSTGDVGPGIEGARISLRSRAVTPGKGPLMRLRTSFALLLGSAMLLTGCASEEPEPKFAEPSASPSVVKKEETAEEFIRRWNDEQTRMQKGDTEAYREMTPKCSACQSALEKVDDYYRSGGYVTTEGRTIVSIKPSDRSTKSKRLFMVEMNSAPTRYRTSASAPEKTLKGGSVVYELLLSKKQKSWEFLDYWQVAS